MERDLPQLTEFDELILVINQRDYINEEEFVEIAACVVGTPDKLTSEQLIVLSEALLPKLQK